MSESTSDIAKEHHCPLCGYNLRGLPEVYTCPECGLDYDLNRIVIPIRGCRRVLSRYLQHLFFLLPGMFMFQCNLASWPPLSTRDWIGFVVLMFGAILFVYSLIRHHKNYYTHVVLDRSGVRFCTADEQMIHYAWSDVEEARCVWFGGDFHLVGKDGMDLFSCNGDDLGGWSKTCQCVSAVNKARERFQDRND